MLNVWYYTDAPKTVAPQLDAIRRQSTFDEVTQGLDETNALFEARRCLSCGNCFGCDNCYGVCPDNAVLKIDEADGYAFDLDYCKGCGICVTECPCGAIEMVPESSLWLRQGGQRPDDIHAVDFIRVGKRGQVHRGGEHETVGFGVAEHGFVAAHSLVYGR
jgi:Pyruvate/2-oxoacid:ferredoxin oxidoreductase delta subunit